MLFRRRARRVGSSGSSSPPQGDADWTYYIDGSLVDGPSKRFSRAGFAIAIARANGDLVAYALGVPPDWARSAPAAEAWALLKVFASCPSPPRIVTDCYNLVTGLGAGRAAATGAKRPLARLWGMIFQTLDGGISPDDVEKVLTWMPSHGSKAVIGHAIKSDGTVVSALDWRANRLVDALAKAAAGRGRVDDSIKAFWDDAGETVEFCAATLGMVTFAANNFRESSLRADGSYVYAHRRDACPIPFLDPTQRPLRRTARGRDAASAAASASAASAPPPPPTASTRLDTGEQDQHATELAALARGAKARAATAAALKEEHAQRRFTQSWHLERAAAAAQRAPQPTPGQARLEALRLRVLARSSPA